MNFISKNLGWIMLFLFFLFMLFIISTNQKANLNPDPASTGALTTDSGSVVSNEAETEELNSLMDKLTEGEEEETEDVVNEDLVDDSELEDKEEKSSFFDFFRRPKSDISEDDVNTTESGATVETETGSTDDTSMNQEEATNEEESSVNESGTGVVVSSLKAGLSKNTANIAPVETQYAFKTIGTINKIDLPGIHLETAVGKKYEIGVHSLKLNNRFFNQTLAYMMRGDVIEQISEAKDGRFKAKIITSSNSNNIGKVGFVSKKYLTDTSYTGSEAQAAPVPVDPTRGADNRVEAEVTHIPTTVTEAPISREYFNPTNAIQLKDASGNDLALMGHADVLKKIGAEDANGCFQVRIVGSNYCDNQGMVGYVCRGDLKSYAPAQD